MADIIPADLGQPTEAEMEVRRSVLRTILLAKRLPTREAKSDLAQWIDAATDEVAHQWGLA